MNATTRSLPFARPLPWRARWLFSLLERLECGRLAIVTPEGARHVFEGPRAGPAAEMSWSDWGVLPALAGRAEIGLFEMWRDGRLGTPDMTALLELLARNQPALERVFHGHPVRALLLRVAHALRANTRRGARRNIHAHYDLGNAFYALWLDPTMSYSSGLYAGEPGRTLEQAQLAKYDRMIEALDIAPGQHVLEVGCGWGGFAERVLGTRDCRLTGITISRAQLEYARARLAGRGLADRARIEFRDYRDLEGRYERIASIEMLEAVGERWWPRYFRMLEERLAPGGVAALQSIVIAPAAFEAYRATSDFIREYIFPGGMLPTVPRIEAEARAAGLEVREVFDFGPDYARTLRLWREAFDAREPEVRALGFDDAFLAAWRFYLHYCEAGFLARRVSVVQVTLARPE